MTWMRLPSVDCWPKTGNNVCHTMQHLIRRRSFFWCVKVIQKGSKTGRIRSNQVFPSLLLIQKPPAARVGLIWRRGAMRKKHQVDRQQPLKSMFLNCLKMYPYSILVHAVRQSPSQNVESVMSCYRGKTKRT